MIISIIIYTVLLFVPVLSKSETKNSVLKAHELYNKAKWADAEIILKLVDNPGPAVWHTLGNCYWHMKKYKDAFFAYKRAWKNSSFNDKKNLKEMLDKSKEQWAGKKSIEQIEGLGEYWDAMLKPIIWQCIFLFIWIILLLSFKAWSRGTFFKLNVFFWILIALLSLYSLRHFTAYDDRKAVVVHNTELLIVPKKGVASLKALSIGDEVVLVDVYQDWAKVKSQNDLGWIMQSDCEVI